MPLVRARCRACTLPLGDPPPTTLTVRCGRCGVQGAVRVAGDGQPTDFDPAFSPVRLMAWLASARVAMAAGTPGIALGACAGCSSPLLVSSRDLVALPCPHCGELVQAIASEILADQWTEPWARVEGGDLDLEYRLTLLEEHRGVSAGCAACGQPTPAGAASSRCARCGSVIWVERGGGRMQLGVRIDGTRGERPFQALVSIAEGEARLRSDAMIGSSARSGRSLLGATGIGCATTIAVVVASGLGIWIAVHFAHC